MSKTAVFSTSEKGNLLAKSIQEELVYTDTFSTKEDKSFLKVESFADFVEWSFDDYDHIILIGDLADNILNLTPYIKEQYKKLLIFNVDVNGDFVQILQVGEEGEANQEAQKLAGITGGTAIISTQAKASKEWDLESFTERFEWEADLNDDWESVRTLFRTRTKVALILEVRDMGSAYLEKTAPSFVEIFYHVDDLEEENFDLIIAVSPLLYRFKVTSVMYRPKILTLGMGCHKNFPHGILVNDIQEKLAQHGISWKAIRTLSTADSKSKEMALLEVCHHLKIEFKTYSSDFLNRIPIPNPSDVILKHTGLRGLAESAALAVSKTNKLIVEKQNDKPECNQYYTWALAIDQLNLREGQLEIVGAGPGNPDLITLQGMNLLRKADLVIYSSTLLRDDLIHHVKTGAKIRSVESLTQQENLIQLIQSYYRRGLMTVWLHSGDANLFSDIQDELIAFTKTGMEYRITPGVGNFQALEAELKTKFLINRQEQEVHLIRVSMDNLNDQKQRLKEYLEQEDEICIYADRNVMPDLHQFFSTILSSNTPIAISALKNNALDQLIVCEQKDIVNVCNTQLNDGIVILRMGFNLVEEVN